MCRLHTVQIDFHVCRHRFILLQMSALADAVIVTGFIVQLGFHVRKSVEIGKKR